MLEIMAFLLIISIPALVLSMPVCWYIQDNKDEIKSDIKLIKSKLKPRTPLQKEIADEKREIAILERQKADMAELEELKAKREKLFEEVESSKYLRCDGSRIFPESELEKIRIEPISADNIEFTDIDASEYRPPILPDEHIYATIENTIKAIDEEIESVRKEVEKLIGGKINDYRI